MPRFDRTDVDPSVTDEDIERALDVHPTHDYPSLDADQDDVDDETPTGFLSLAAIVPASIPQRILNAKRLRDDHTFVGVGMCHRTVRGPILGLPAVYPTAAIAGAHSAPFHPITDPASTSVPRGAIGFAFNGGSGHTWLELGAVKVGGAVHALTSTTDYHELGFEGVALRDRMLSWCGADRWGWGESDNGFDVWPDEAKPVPVWRPWTLEERAQHIADDLAAARHAGHDREARQLKAWHDRMVARLNRK